MNRCIAITQQLTRCSSQAHTGRDRFALCRKHATAYDEWFFLFDRATARKRITQGPASTRHRGFLAALNVKNEDSAA